MGVVYEAHDRETGQRVALKTLKHADPQSLYHFKREFRTVQGFQHPNVITLGELFEAEGHWFFTMELVDGDDFLTYVRRGAKPTPIDDTSSLPVSPLPANGDTLPLRRAGVSGLPVRPTRSAPPADERLLRPALGQLALGIATLHEHGIIHRDIKPSNIRVATDGRVVVLDFGVAALAVRDPHSTANRLVGTPAYMAPEQALAGEGRPEADWYSLGVVMYEALVGQLPHSGRTDVEVLARKQHFAPAPPRSLFPGVPEDLAELSVELLRLEAADRPREREILERLGVSRRASPATVATSSPSVHLTSSAPFVGRAAELDVLRRAFAEVQRGGTRAVSVVGESGLGKTALLRNFVELLDAEAAGVVVLEGRCYERESVPYKAFDGVVDSLSQYMRQLSEQEAAVLVPPNAALLSRVFPVLGRVECIARAPRPPAEIKDPHELRGRVFAALRELLFLLAERKPLVLLIDDMQWADADSLLLLRELLREGHAPRLLLLMSSRVDMSSALSQDMSGDAHDTALTGVSHDSLALGPLDPSVAPELAELLLRRAGGTTAAAASIAVEARGHPLYIDELVRHVAIAGERDREALRLDDAIWARASNLPSLARHVLEIVCVAGAPLPQETLAQAAKLQLADFMQRVALLRVGNFLRSGGARGADVVEPYHDRVREAVFANIEAEALVERHRRIAIALETSGAVVARPELLVRHLEAAGETQRAAELAAEAAQRATNALAFDRAVQLYRSALRLGEYHGDVLVSLRIALAEALVYAGLGPEAAEEYLAAAQDAEPATRLDCERKAAEQLLVSGHIERGIATLTGVLAAHGVRLPKTPRHALASVVWRRAYLRLRGLRWEERRASEVSDRDLSRIDVFRAVSQGMALVDTIRGADFQVRGLLLALKTGERTRVADFILREAVYIGSQGVRHVPRAKRLVETGRKVASDSEDPFLKAWIVGADGALSYFSGRYGDAERLCAESEGIFRGTMSGVWWEISTACLFRLYALVRMGRFRELADARTAYLRDAAYRGDRYAETTIKRYSGVVWLAQDRPRDGLDELDRTTWPLPERAFHLQHWYELSARAEVALYQDNVGSFLEGFVADFDKLERSLLFRVEMVRALARWLRGRVALSAALSSTEPAPHLAMAAKAARQLQREHLPSAHAWASFISGAIAAQRGDEETAIAQVRQARELSNEHEMPFCGAVAMWREGRLVGGDEGAALVARSRESMASEGIENPARMCDIVAPGFGDD